MRRSTTAMLLLALALGAAGCQETIHHAELTPEMLDFGIIDIGGDGTLELTLSSLVEEDSFVYFLAPTTYVADLVPAGDDQGEPFQFGEEPIELPAGDALTFDVRYTCWAQDRGSFRWDISAMSSLDDSGYWNATREVGTLVLKGSCGDEAD